jgi:hypothetical protein
VYRNPTKKQRAEIDIKHGPVDWEPFGAASDEGGVEFKEEHFNVYCDDAKQNSFHTKSVMDASIAVFIEGRPWLNGAREARVQSDQAANYRDPTTEIDLTCVGTRLFSTEGMGKDEGDAAGAVIKSKMKRMRDAGDGIESADDLLSMGSRMDISGQTHAKLKLRRTNEDSGIKGRDSVCRNYAFWTIDEEYITFWESIDSEASRVSMKTTGRAVGIGPGVKMTIAEFNEKQRTQLMATGASLEMADGKSCAPPNPKERGSRTQKCEMKTAAKEKKEGAALAAEEKRNEETAKKEGMFARNIDECSRCQQQFLTKGQFILHRRRWCPSRHEVAETRKKARHVPTMLRATDALAVEGRKLRISSLDEVVVSFCVPKGGSATMTGLTLKQSSDKSVFEVAAVSGLAATFARVAAGYIVESIEGGSGLISPAVGELPLPSIGVQLLVKLKRPQPKISFHGIARKGIHSAPRFTMHARQTRWLEENVFFGNQAHMRPSCAWDSMKAFFSTKMRTDMMTPMWLEKDQIAKWLAGKKSEEKTRRRENAKKQKSGEKASVKLPQSAPSETKAPVKTGKDKGKKIAAASTKDTGNKKIAAAARAQPKAAVKKGKGKRAASSSTSTKKQTRKQRPGAATQQQGGDEGSEEDEAGSSSSESDDEYDDEHGGHMSGSE